MRPPSAITKALIFPLLCWAPFIAISGCADGYTDYGWGGQLYYDNGPGYYGPDYPGSGWRDRDWHDHGWHGNAFHPYGGSREAARGRASLGGHAGFAGGAGHGGGAAHGGGHR